MQGEEELRTHYVEKQSIHRGGNEERMEGTVRMEAMEDEEVISAGQLDEEVFGRSHVGILIIEFGNVIPFTGDNWWY